MLKQRDRSRYELAEWPQILEAFGHRCAYCGDAIGPLTKDHVTPISKGGINTADNVVPACKSCNSRKHNRGILSMVNVPYMGTRQKVMIPWT
jgi:5-methylcytosine-specific restriction endonuclease McrA